jgi:RNA polymerase sigma-70 factor (ECF subfamily)
VGHAERDGTVAEVTGLLQNWNVDPVARDRVLELLYDELKRRAARQLRRERREHTLSPTALVNESYLRMASQDGPWENRAQFLAVASRMMRRILVDHARARLAGRREMPLRVGLTEDGVAGPPTSVDLLGLDEALDDLAREAERSARLVELRFFGGLTQDEAAAALSVSLATAARDWSFARAWLFRRLSSAPTGPR